MTRRVLLVVHTGRARARVAAETAARAMQTAGLQVAVLDTERDGLDISTPTSMAPDCDAAVGAELVIAVGGDGTLLRAAEYARPTGVPLLGVNVGHVGFLADIEPDRLDLTIEHVLRGVYTVAERATVDVSVIGESLAHWRGWALNEVTVEKASRERMVDVVAEVDGQPLSRYGCDGLVVATPTGSTAYAFSAGGPIVAPDVDALVLVPISAHALFARPLVVGPGSVIAIEVLPTAGGAVLCCDGRRTRPLDPGDRVEVRRGSLPVRLAQIHAASFTERLVAKFELPVHGWRGADR